MPIEHTFRYLKSTSKGIEEVVTTKELTRSLAIKYNCLDCVGGRTVDVKRCNIKTCPLYIFRPYQK